MSFKSVKEFISEFKKPFKKEVIAIRKAKKRLRERNETCTKKAIEEEKDLIIAEWDKKTENGINIHKYIQDKKLSILDNCIFEGYKGESYDYDDINLEDNKLERGKIYFEKFIIDPINRLLGYSDEVEVTEDGYINICDYKSFDKLKIGYTYVSDTGFKIIEKFHFPINHLVLCNYNETALQASFYMYLLWNTNRRLKPGKITLLHTMLDEDGEIISEDIYELPYLLNEVKQLLLYSKK